MTDKRDLPVYISLKEAAEIMSSSQKTIRRLIAAGEIPAYTVLDGPGAAA